MGCGDWWWAVPGSVAGRTKANCPCHGTVVMEQANVDEPEGVKQTKFWTLREALEAET